VPALSTSVNTTDGLQVKHVPALSIMKDTNDDRSDVWIGDSGAGEHMTCRLDWLTNYKKLEPKTIEVVLGDET
jgi:hypothetical protein